jgi:hypothetical protein
LEHAAHELLPLFDALTKADDPNSEYAKYRPKLRFRLRLFEAQDAIAEHIQRDATAAKAVAAQPKKHGAKGGKKSGSKRRAAADRKWRDEARRIALAYDAAPRQTPPRRTDFIEEIKREFKRKGKASALQGGRAIGKVVDAMRREGKIKLAQ